MIEERIRNVAALLKERFDPQYAEALLDDVDHGEPTIGMEDLLVNLFDDEVTLDLELVKELVELGRLVGADPRTYEPLAKRFL